MAKKRKVTFHSYRYQLLPTSQHIQMSLDGAITGVEDLKKRKNEFFRDALENIPAFAYSRAETRHKLWTFDSLLILQLGVERDLKRKTREFEVEEVENWPTVFVVFSNDPAVQKCLIQCEGGFQKTATVVRLIEASLNTVLAQQQLAIAFEPIYAESYFWDLVDRYEGKITQIEFELISPNLSNISASLTLDLGALNQSTNTQRTNLQLNSDENATLTPSAEDPLIQGLVRYSSDGGGDISIRAKGLRRKIHTARGVTELSIDELLIEGASPEQLVGVFRDLMQ